MTTVSLDIHSDADDPEAAEIWAHDEAEFAFVGILAGEVDMPNQLVISLDRKPDEPLMRSADQVLPETEVAIAVGSRPSGGSFENRIVRPRGECRRVRGP